ncbi:hypothetical protein LEP1GSC133_3750 [Leptospira borgpetersenii serovar Pomona str. 200901868]|uniref:Uncharacterized protein n=1 Tax=Leptospira borgpetersenii serovar Pomona str. 200901868 TaxID=1192866 RepID=M6VRZ0_LEPBO|nr:hypothetical protein LEP1GSC133_3750 [Leptospira borgpetersenii serovar Pomona str. 200901868]
MILLNRLYSRYPNLKDILYNSGWLFLIKFSEWEWECS